MNSILEELIVLVEGLGIPVETGIFSEKAPKEYVVITPLSDMNEVFADNRPHFEIQEARLSLFSKRNYQQTKTALIAALIFGDFVITGRRYVEHEDDTGYHHYSIDVQKNFSYEAED